MPASNETLLPITSLCAESYKERKFDALCLDPIPQYDREKIRSLRAHLQVSQAVLAAVLNTSLSTAISTS